MSVLTPSPSPPDPSTAIPSTEDSTLVRQDPGEAGSLPTVRRDLRSAKTLNPSDTGMEIAKFLLEDGILLSLIHI